jgi:hypothetical protein
MIDKRKIAIGAGLVLAAWATYRVYRVLKDGEATLGKILMAPFTGAKDLYNVESNAVATLSAPGTVAALNPVNAVEETIRGNDLTAQLATRGNDYAPGGRIYNQVAATQGQAVADANWQKVQNDLATDKEQNTGFLNYFFP